MIPGLSTAAGGGLSMSDSTTVSFDPFADQRATKGVTNNIKSVSGISLEAILPLVLVAGLIWVVLKLIK